MNRPCYTLYIKRETSEQGPPNKRNCLQRLLQSDREVKCVYSVELCFHPRTIMSSEEMYLDYRGYRVPKVAHSLESLEFAQEFKFKDDDVVAVTYPKSGLCLKFTKEIFCQ